MHHKTRANPNGQWLFIITLLCLFALPVRAAIPDNFDYQGYLTDSGGSPINSTLNISFSLYNVDTGGIALWSDTQAVTVSNGLFNVKLGGGSNPFPLGMFDDPLWLGIDVEGDGEMVPRVAISSAAFAHKADDATTLEGQSAASLDQSTHVSDTNNPHTVTAAQIGAASAPELATHATDVAAHHSKYTDTEAVAAVQAADGSGSGLDADLLDGNDASAFASAVDLTAQQVATVALQGRVTDNETAIAQIQTQLGNVNCIPGDYVNCYTGTPGTAGTGLCTTGIRTCNASGQYGICAGEVIPQTEVCDGQDNNCDGQTDEGGVCDIVDRDGDGFTPAQGDCNDDDINVHPGAADTPDDLFIDKNCDGIDGTVSQLLFVASATGSDSNPGTPAAPFATIGAALAAAPGATGITGIAVSNGTYNERITVVNGYSIYGGYASQINWQRAAGYKPTINGLVQGNQKASLVADNIATATVVEYLSLASSVSTAGVNNYGAYITNSPALTLRKLNVSPGGSGTGASTHGLAIFDTASITIEESSISTANGSTGLTGASGTTGENGPSGQAGQSAQSNSSSGGYGGLGGSHLCNGVAASGGTGGRGGYDTGSGSTGQSGTGSGTGGIGGAGGAGGTVNGLTCDVGSSGQNGTAGQTSSPGTAGAGGNNTYGSFVSGLWIGSNGFAGGDGTFGRGGGGGGGGGGGADAVLCNADRGAGGGGGGAGGCGGTGGFGGTAGGGAFGIVLVNTTANITNTTINTGDGGQGGAGGYGGFGGTGGNGATGGSAADDGRPGGNGASGATGSRGGGGGGGCGGVSIGIAHVGTSTSNRTNVTFSSHSGGDGGTGGSPNGMSGCTGYSADIRNY